MEKRTAKIFKEVKDYIVIALGLLCYTSAWIIFMIPNGLVGGGVSGIGVIIQYATGFPISYSFFLINLVLLGIALKVLGRGFGAKTVFAILVTSVFFKVIPMVIPEAFIQEIISSNGKLLCSLLAGAISGFGIALTFSRGGSTGGTDIIALMINKHRNISVGKIILVIDIFIIASSMLIPSEASLGQRLANVMYGYVMTAACGYSLDLFVSGTKQSFQVFIFSKKYEKIADAITNDLKRGVTILDGKGWYSKENGKILLVILRKSESNVLFKMTKEIDSDAFMSVGSVMGVYGAGFDKIKK